MTNRYYLTKSDFKVAQTCPTKLYYRKKGYPTLNDGDENLQMLADQGYLIETLARTLYPDGRWVGYSQDVVSAARETAAALTDDCTLFEATFLSGGKMARADILVRRGRVIELIEIKSRGFDHQLNAELVRDGKPNLFHAPRSPLGISNEWRPYLEDAAFQAGILEELFPEARVVPYLLMPDTSRATELEGLHRQFELRPSPTPDAEHPHAPHFTGDPETIRRDPFLVRVDVSKEVALLMPEVRRQSELLLQSLNPSLQRIYTRPSTNCRGCEFWVTEGTLRGFHDCWGELADVTPHILDLHRVRSVQYRKEIVADGLIAQGKASLYDMGERFLARRDGTLNSYHVRQRIQIRHTRENREWVSDELGPRLRALAYPLHFIDFETCTPAIPRYRGMRPFEIIAFQWSCHTVATPDAEPQHDEWLQAADTFPNADFVASLRRRVGETGTVLVWSRHETTVLKTIRRQLEERGDGGSENARWIDRLLSSGRIVDLNDLTLKHYFHPLMGGRTSLKIVTEAIWRTNEKIRRRLPQYRQESAGGPASPYQALPALMIDGREIAVAEGQGATLAYYAMMEGGEAERWRRLLRQYCELDTLAMVMVWWHWRELTGQVEGQHRQG